MTTAGGESVSSLRLDSQQAMDWPEPFAASVVDKLVVMPGTDGVAVAQYRRLADALQQARTGRYLKTVMVTSARRDEGRTLSAVNLALTLSEGCRQRVLLVDADLEKPSVHALFEVSPTPGLWDYLAPAHSTDEMPVIGLTDHLSFVAGGHSHGNPAKVLGSPRMARLLVDAGAAFDWVILDSGPVDCHGAIAPLLAIVDAALLVVSGQHEAGPEVAQAVEAIGRDRLLGIVVNRARVAAVTAA